MIKIIKEGTKDIRECESCGCLFSFDEEDTEAFAENMHIRTYVKCPQCSRKVDLSYQNAPIIKENETVVDQKKTLDEQGLPSCWTCDFYNADFAFCGNCMRSNIDLAENTCCTEYKEKEND